MGQIGTSFVELANEQLWAFAVRWSKQNTFLHKAHSNGKKSDFFIKRKKLDFSLKCKLHQVKTYLVVYIL